MQLWRHRCRDCYLRFWKAHVRVRKIRTIQTAGANACPLELRDTRAGAGAVLRRCQYCLFCFNILAPVPITCNNLCVGSRLLFSFPVSVAITMWVPIPAMLQAMWYFRLRSGAKFDGTGAGNERFPWCRCRCRYGSKCWVNVHASVLISEINTSFLLMNFGFGAYTDYCWNTFSLFSADALKARPNSL